MELGTYPTTRKKSRHQCCQLCDNWLNWKSISHQISPMSNDHTDLLAIIVLHLLCKVSKVGNTESKRTQIRINHFFEQSKRWRRKVWNQLEANESRLGRSPVARWLVTNVTEEFHRSSGRRRRGSLIFGVVVRHDLWLQLPPLNLRKDVRKAHPMLWDTRLLMPLLRCRRPLKSRKTGRDPFHDAVMPTAWS